MLNRLKISIMGTISYKELSELKHIFSNQLNEFCATQGLERCCKLDFGWDLNEVEECKVNWCCMGSVSPDEVIKFTACLNFAMGQAEVFNAQHKGKKIVD